VQATVVRYSLSNDNATPAPNATPVPKLEVIGYDAELQLGGHYLTLKLRQRLVEAFRQQHPKADGDISGNPQAMAKLLKEADRVKKV
jgi:molecular chaperone DnaK (HSP70)